MPIEQKILAGNCEITTGAFTPTTSMPTFQGENNAVRMEITFFNDGAAYNIPSGIDVRAHLYYAARPAMTQSLQMEVVGNLATLDVSDLFTAVSGTPLMVVRLVDSSGDIQVSCTFGVNVKPTLSGTVIYLLPPSPDEIIYVGRSPYVGNNGNWWTFDNDLHVFVDSGYASTGNYYVFAKWSASAPTQDSDMQDTPADWIGWYTGPAMTAPAHYTDYVWFLQKGATGATGASGTNGADGDDGVGIVSVAKTSTAGLVDTYTITYTDATTSTFTVTNGADGADGATGANGTNGTNGTNAYVHIKWSAVNPTQNSDMTDTPSAYIGIYSGASATAPTTYTSYVWYRYKGETGAAGQGVPTGGTTGQALVKSSATNYATEWGAVGRTNSDILHNGGWVTPINQRGHTGAVSNAYCIDRWIGNGTVTPVAGQYVTLANGTTMIQRSEILPAKLLGKTYTFSVMIGDAIQSAQLTFPSAVGGSPDSETLTGLAVEVGYVDLGSGNTSILENVSSRYIPYLKITASAAINVQRVKLELGEVSTLSLSGYGDYLQAFRACEWYYKIVQAYAYCYSNGYIQPIYFSRMRVAPSLVGNGTLSKVQSSAATEEYAITAAPLTATEALYIAATGAVSGAYCRVTLVLSADL